ncbi:unnamed protein product [Gadus morhua 'NCC']
MKELQRSIEGMTTTHSLDIRCTTGRPPCRTPGAIHHLIKASFPSNLGVTPRAESWAAPREPWGSLSDSLRGGPDSVGLTAVATLLTSVGLSLNSRLGTPRHEAPPVAMASEAHPREAARSFITLNKGCLITEPDRDTPRALSSAKVIIQLIRSNRFNYLSQELGFGERWLTSRQAPAIWQRITHMGWAAAAGAHGQLGVMMRRMLPINRSLETTGLKTGLSPEGSAWTSHFLEGREMRSSSPALQAL